MKTDTPLNPPSPQCPGCRRPLAPNAPGGLCAACLLAQGLAGDTEVGPDQEPFTAPPVEAVARLFPQLEVLSLLGKGGMGAVYQARQPALDRLVALKVLPVSAAQRERSAERFNREARALARLNHPNIVGVHEFGEVDGWYYFLMEFVDGVNLRQLQRSGRLSPREALQIVPQICDALQYAHDEGVVHRDIKPENVLVDRKGRVKIADFGLARLQGTDATALRLTGEGQVLGTPHYMAPEQLEHPSEVDHRADIYALGVVFYELLTGELPLGKFAPPSERSRGVRIDVRLDQVVLHALEKQPERRYQHASEVKTDVEGIASTIPLPALGPEIAAAETAGGEETLRLERRPPQGRRLLWAGFLLSAIVLPVGLDLDLPLVWGLCLTGVVLCALGLWGPRQEPARPDPTHPLPDREQAGVRRARIWVPTLLVVGWVGILMCLNQRTFQRTGDGVQVVEVGFPDVWYRAESSQGELTMRLISGRRTSFWVGLGALGALVTAFTLDARVRASRSSRTAAGGGGGQAASIRVAPWLCPMAGLPLAVPRVMWIAITVQILMAGWKVMSAPAYGAWVVADVLLILGLLLRLRVAYVLVLFFAALGVLVALPNLPALAALGVLAINGIVAASVLASTRWFFPPTESGDRSRVWHAAAAALFVLPPALWMLFVQGGHAALGVDLDADVQLWAGLFGLPLMTALGAVLAGALNYLTPVKPSATVSRLSVTEGWSWQAILGGVVFILSLPCVGGAMVMGRLIQADGDWNPATGEAIFAIGVFGLAGMGVLVSALLGVALLRRIEQAKGSMRGRRAARAILWFWLALAASLMVRFESWPAEAGEQALQIEHRLEINLSAELLEAGYEPVGISVTLDPHLGEAECRFRQISKDGQTILPEDGNLALVSVGPDHWRVVGKGALEALNFEVGLGNRRPSTRIPWAATSFATYEVVLTDPDDDPNRSCLDLDTGEVTATPVVWPTGGLAQAQEAETVLAVFRDRVRGQGLDLMSDASGRSLNVFDLAWVKIPVGDLDRLSEQDIRWRIAQLKGDLHDAALSLAVTPTALVYRTREGGQGVLQVLEFQEHPRAVKLRVWPLPPGPAHPVTQPSERVP